MEERKVLGAKFFKQGVCVDGWKGEWRQALRQMIMFLTLNNNLTTRILQLELKVNSDRYRN